MRRTGGGRVILALLIALLSPAPLLSQSQPPAQSLLITARQASTWSDGPDSVVQLDGPVTINLDRTTTLSAKNAVVWVRDARGGQAGEQAVSVALIGDAQVLQPDIKRTGDRLIVTARVNGPIRITAENRLARDLHDTQIYRDADLLRKEGERPQPVPGPGGAGAAAPGVIAIATSPFPTTSPTSAPTTSPYGIAATTRPARQPIHYSADTTENLTASDGKMAVVLTGHVAITRNQSNGAYLEMQCDRAVLFTTLHNLREVGKLQDVNSIEEAITAAYLEGDVRISMTPAQANKGEQRLQANRVYYQFTTDRAVLTDAVIHSFDPERNIPAIVRAQTVRQLSEGEYRAKKTEITTSGFAVPSFSIRADKAYIRQEDTGDPRYGARTTFVGNNVTLNAFHVPVFYLPVASATVTERGSALRDFEVGHSNQFGTSVETRWGLFESFGQIPPPELDASYKLDYYSERGPAFGLDADYAGGIISETTRQAWNFKGDFKSYFVPNDQGIDDLGRHRGEVDPTNDFRGRVLWEHQHVFPDDWTLQLRTGWESDPTFIQEWFEDEFHDALPLESSLYLKRQRETEAITFLTTVQPNNVATNSDFLAEQFEVERVPQLGYYRIGDSWLEDHATFISQNTLERVRFNVSGTDLGDQGFRFKRNVKTGQPNLGLLGVTGANGPPIVPEDFTDRADFREELDFPFAAGEFHLLPYVFGRYTGYSDSPDYNVAGVPDLGADNGGGRVDRGFVGAGVRINTQFWKIDNTANSDTFDIHRVRHIIEPELHLWTTATNTDPDQMFIYDEQVDRLFDTTGMQLALRQRWQTKRGGPGQERTVDFLTFNVEYNLFQNQPPQSELIPLGMRGIFFPSMPEASVPRNSINADASWRISDTTILLADAAYNADQGDLATAAVGLIAQREPRTRYFVGLRYIDLLNSAIGTFAMDYQLSSKYSVGFRQSYDFADTVDVYSSVSIQRRFDRFFLLLTVYNDSTSGQNGFGIGFFPEGLGRGVSSDALENSFNKQR